MNLITVLATNYDAVELQQAAKSLGVLVGDLPDGITAMSMALIGFCEQTNQLLKLFDILPDRGFSFDSYLYLEIANRFNSIEKMRDFADRVGMNYENQLVRRLGYKTPSQNPDVLKKQALTIQEWFDDDEGLREWLDSF